jgi:UDP-2,3-diacylglucosamine hydrolase
VSGAGTPEPLPEIPLEPGTRIIADLHLDLGDAAGPREFLRWLAGQRGIPRLVVLGDLFDVWVGQAQERLPSAPPVLDGLRDLVAGGTKLEILHGNRDFLLDRRFEASTARACARGVRRRDRRRGNGRGRGACYDPGDGFCTRTSATRG